ncbi:hypothetical protein E4T44_04741 [Aureobasidium sp. EXF-8845]|nr:hypothetical protein E4T44_04741 [Aureobasidium sp. EXF-8845]
MPRWLDREKARLKANKHGGGTAEENTRKRREERKLFKLERARAEAEQIEETLRKERAALGSVDEEKDEEKATEIAISHVFPWMQQQDSDAGYKEETTTVPAEDKKSEEPATNIVEVPILPTGSTIHTTGIPNNTALVEGEEEEETPITNQEHLQLNLEESFFLSYGLGSLQILDSNTKQPLSIPSLLTLFRQHSHYPIAQTSSLRPDDPFLLNYVVYHHYHSLGWVVRPGVKFSCDFLLYNRGPVFSHAEFALLIVPEYAKGSIEAAEGKGKMGWWWLHCVNRVQSQVKKSLIIVYVKVPRELPSTEQGEVDIGKDPPDGITAGPVEEDDLFVWEALIEGPEGTPYEGGIFPAELKFPKDYPLMPPTMKFLSDIWHPNVYPNGVVCISILHPPGDDPNHYEHASERWSPIQSVEKILISVMSMLAEPNDESPANVDAARMWRERRAEFEKKVRQDVRRSLGL